jgi:hypothetical protein
VKYGPLKLGCFVAVLALVVAGCGSSATSSAPKPSGSGNPIEQAFVHLLAKQHPGYRGPSMCPSVQVARGTGERQPCIAELHRGNDYVQVWAYPTRGTTVAFHPPLSRSWARHWSRYSRPPQRISPGLISVNAPGFDWRWLLLGVDYECRQKHRTTCTAGALAGAFPGPNAIFNFHCHDHGRLIACRNSLGDAMRWLPNAA